MYLDVSDYDPDDDSSGDDDDDEECMKDPKKSIPDDLLWEMCRTGTSFVALSKILKLGFSVFGEADNFHLSSSHLFKSYQRISETKAIAYESEIRTKASLGTICFDHHNMKQLSGKFIAREHRLAIIWHSNSADKLLSIDKIENKTAASQTSAILRSCQFFDVEKYVKAVACDNENTNTGIDNGTCVRLENELQRNLLRLMCRHHIHEIVVKDVYRYLFSSGAPTNLFHPILAEAWSELKSNNFRFDGFGEHEEDTYYFENENQARTYENFKELALQQLGGHCNHPFIRDDYMEIVKVSLKFLSGDREILTKANQVQFNALQNPSNARFMASSIQALKCYLFRHHLNWESNDREKIRDNLPRFCLFLALIYVRYWNRSSILFDAGFNDLNFLQELEKFSVLDQGISRVAIEAKNRHLYYLSEELVVLCLFSDKLSSNEKNQFASALLRLNEDIPERNLRLNHIKYNENVSDWRNKQLIDFVGPRSLFLFQTLEISQEFLVDDANDWSTNASYLNAKSKISSSLICVNDATERVISTSKYKYKRQRCKNDNSFNRSMLENFISE